RYRFLSVVFSYCPIAVASGRSAAMFRRCAGRAVRAPAVGTYGFERERAGPVMAARAGTFPSDRIVFPALVVEKCRGLEQIVAEILSMGIEHHIKAPGLRFAGYVLGRYGYGNAAGAAALYAQFRRESASCERPDEYENGDATHDAAPFRSRPKLGKNRGVCS